MKAAAGAAISPFAMRHAAFGALMLAGVVPVALAQIVPTPGTSTHVIEMQRRSACCRSSMTWAIRWLRRRPTCSQERTVPYRLTTMACKAWYQVETLAKGDPPEGETRDDYTYRLRQEHSVPLLTAFKTWLDEQAPHVLPDSLLGKAISYTRNQWQYLSRYVTDAAPLSTTT